MKTEGAKEHSKAVRSREQPKKRPVGTKKSAPGLSVAQQQPASSGNTAPSETPTGPPQQQPAEYQMLLLSESEKEAMQMRAEARARVPLRMRDSFNNFFFSPTGTLKLARLGLLIEALVCFIITKTHESYIAVTVLEICMVLFFILIYMLTLHRLMTCLHWPLLDLINSFITAVFLFIVGALIIQDKERTHLLFVGGSLCLAAAIVCLVDATIVTKTMRSNMKKALGIDNEASLPLAPVEPTQKPDL